MLDGRYGVVVLAAATVRHPGLQGFLYSATADPVAQRLLALLGSRAPLLSEESIEPWIRDVLPGLVRIAASERRVSRGCRRAMHSGPGLLPAKPLNADGLADAVRHAIIDAVLAREPRKRRAARILGMPESSLRWYLDKKNGRT